MSFAKQIKQELCNTQNDSIVALKALFYGLALFAGPFSHPQGECTSENEFVANLYGEMLQTHLNCKYQIRSNGEKSKKRTYTVCTPAPYKEKLLKYFGYTGHEPSLRIHPTLIDDEEQRAAFLRGAFLACGHITDPRKSYHMEFVVPYLHLSQDLAALIEQVLIKPKIILRKGMHVVYFKDSANIEDMLTIMGAVKSTLEMMDIKIYKDVRNNANRITNCETANIDKTVTASQQQIEDIEYIRQTRGLDCLTPELREIAALRLENPEMSLRELGAMLEKPISRSGLNHRLNRLRKIAQDLRESRKEAGR